MKAATKKSAAAPARGRQAKNRAAAVPKARLSRTQWLVIAAVVGVVVLGLGGYYGWKAFTNKTVDYNTALRASPAYKSYQVGILAAQAGRDNEAEEAFQRARTEDPSNAIIYNALATLYLNKGNVQKAIVTCEDGIIRAPGWPDLYYTLGLARYQAGRFADAEQALQRALDLKPDLADAALWLGNTYMVESRFGGADGSGDPTKLAAAIDQFRRAVAIDSEVAAYHAALADGLLLRRDLAEARQELERAVELDPNNAKYLLTLGKVCDQLDDLDAAVAAFQRSSQLDGTEPEAFYGLGLAYFKRQQDAEAVDALRHALKLNPFHIDAHERLGQTLIRMGQQAEGDTELQRAEDSRTRAAKITDLQRASALDPSNTEMANNLGIELARQGDYEGAMQAFQRALAGNPRYIDANYQIGGLYANRGKVLEALDAFNAVDKVQPGYRQTNYFLAKIYEKIGRKTEAEKRMRMYEEQKARGEITDSQP